MAIVTPGVASNYIPGTPGYHQPGTYTPAGPTNLVQGNPSMAPPKPINPRPVAQAQIPAPHSTTEPRGITAPAPLSPLQKWLAGDTTYQQQLAEFNKSRSDYTTNYNTQTSQTQRDYNQTQRQMNQQAQQDRMNQQNDFAGRGILHSGVYAKALGDYNTQFNTQMNNLTTGENDKVGDLDAQRQAFLQELQLQMNAAKQDAIRRRAAQLGL